MTTWDHKLSHCNKLYNSYPHFYNLEKLELHSKKQSMRFLQHNVKWSIAISWFNLYYLIIDKIKRLTNLSNSMCKDVVQISNTPYHISITYHYQETHSLPIYHPFPFPAAKPCPFWQFNFLWQLSGYLRSP